MLQGERFVHTNFHVMLQLFTRSVGSRLVYLHVDALDKRLNCLLIVGKCCGKPLEAETPRLLGPLLVPGAPVPEMLEPFRCEGNWPQEFG